MSEAVPVFPPGEAPGTITPSLHQGLLSMSLSRVVLTVALPAAVTMLLNLMFSLVDGFWIGKLGAGPMAAVSAAGIVTWVLYSLGSLGSVGVQAFVSQATGAGKADLAREAVAAGILLHLILAAAVLIPLYVLQKPMFLLMGLEPSVAGQAADYLGFFLLGMGVYYPAMVAMASFQAVGDTRTPALVLGVSLGLNAVLDPFMILGWGPFEPMGALGAGLATMLAKLLFALVVLVLLKRRGLLDLHSFRTPGMLSRMGQVARIGYPIALNGVFFASVYLVLIRILAPFGTVPVAVLGISHRIEGLAWFTCVGFSIAAAALAGQNFGAGRPQQAVRSVWRLTGVLSAFLAVVSVLFMTLGGPMIEVFIDDPAVVAEGARYLLAIGVFEVLLGFEVVFEESLGAVGASRMALLIAAPLSLARIPLGYLFAIHWGMGVTAVWWVITVTTAAKGLLLAWGFTRGRWRFGKSLAS